MPLPQHPITSPFDRTTQASEVISGIDLHGKTAIVTGGSAGLGVETARTLALAGARVILPVRSRAKAEPIVEQLRSTTGNDRIELADMDLADYASVRAFADAFAESAIALDLLINNAGIMATPEHRIMGGIESQFGTNHLGHMLLACRLIPALAADARVVALSSIGHRLSPISFDDPNFSSRPYDKWRAYGQSKTANALFAVGLNMRLEQRGVAAYAVHPGGIMTELQRDLTDAEMRAFGWLGDDGSVTSGFKSVSGGAATAVWCATSSLLTAGGVYCEDCNIAEAVAADSTAHTGVRPWAIDPDFAERLWSLSEGMLGERFST